MRIHYKYIVILVFEVLIVWQCHNLNLNVLVNTGEIWMGLSGGCNGNKLWFTTVKGSVRDFKALSKLYLF